MRIHRELQQRVLSPICTAFPEGELVTLIGSNGAGKSTTLGSITGIVPASKGTILFDGTDITKKKPSDITKLGIGVSPEGREVFGGLSVEENLRIGAYTRKDAKEIAASFAEVYELFPRLNVDNFHERAGSGRVIHLHGELTKLRSSRNPDLIYGRT